jgi:predicted dehydrogenase
MPNRITRRTFVKRTTAAGIALPFAAHSVGKASANEKLNIAAVGVGGKGRGDIASTSKDQNVVAICDVDEKTLGTAAEKYPQAKVFHDWRKMLEYPGIDAVTVSTPDHMHAPVAATAIQMGKHVYVQKPMSHTVLEARQLRLLAQQHGVVTQMGNQHHSGRGYRTLVDLIRGGAIGKVRETHTWSNRPIWPQGIERPQRSDPVPSWLHWDLWLGVARQRPYVGPSDDSKKQRGVYHPFNWRGWLDFGVGALGDMGCHIIDPVVWSLELGPPNRVWSDGPAPNDETYPQWEIIHYEFPGTAYTAGETIRMTWYDGGKMPAAELARLPAGKSLPSNGSLFIGDEGVLLCPHGSIPQLLPESEFADYEVQLADSNDHYLQWTNACKGLDKTSSSFDYAGPLTETVLLGTIAIRFPGKKLDWNSKELKFRNMEQANQYIHHPYREGWEVKGLESSS